MGEMQLPVIYKCFYIMYAHPQGEKLRTFPRLWTIVVDIPGGKTRFGVKKWWFIPDFCGPLDSRQLYVPYSFLAYILKYLVSLLLLSHLKQPNRAFSHHFTSERSWLAVLCWGQACSSVTRLQESGTNTNTLLCTSRQSINFTFSVRDSAK